MEIVLATNNAHKVDEMTRILKGIYPNADIKTLADVGFFDEIVEDADTLAGNALIKAKTISEKYNVFTVSDDTGLEVDALDGRPGVYTARYAGENCSKDDNINKMLNELKGVPANKRNAKFVCVICGHFPDGKVIYGNGYCEGFIAEERDGTDSFGYDCIFFSEELNKTFGIASAEEKDSVSHRARALKDFTEKLKNEF
ncbi:MAG: RdgB/HAM1 family non-canonical purine NTP pyrophosphatase [Ruminococcaceae bacterium]|nr:RdgB/HAM1 family non-canonical purine NTP pyrophosphatase [Oscillospiraceae bacterium]